MWRWTRWGTSWRWWSPLASDHERAQVEALAQQVQAVTGQSVELAYVDQGDTGEAPAEAAQLHGIRLEVVKHTQAKRGFVLLPHRWVVVECSFAWTARFRRLARDYERLPQTLAGLHFVAFAVCCSPACPFSSDPSKFTTPSRHANLGSFS
jgi:transposase